jgi:hypothetical protein
MNHKHIYYILALTFFLLSSTHQPPALRKPTSRMLQLSCPAGPTSAALPSHPPPMTSAAPPSNLPLGTHASAACARSYHPWAAPVLGAAAPGQRRWHGSLRHPLAPSEVPSHRRPCQPHRLFPALLLPPSVAVLSQSQPLPFLPLPPSPVLIVLGPLLNCC